MKASPTGIVQTHVLNIHSTVDLIIIPLNYSGWYVPMAFGIAAFYHTVLGSYRGYKLGDFLSSVRAQEMSPGRSIRGASFLPRVDREQRE